jgi:hypothetical protein
MATKNEQGISEIVKKYKAYCANIFEVYEDFLFQEFYLPEIHKRLKRNSIPLMNFENIYSGNITTFRKELIYGVISRQQRKTIGERALMSIVSTTEDFLQKIIFRVYRDFEYKLKGNDDNNSTESLKQQEKLLNIIISSNSKDEIINRFAEEKIRNIFYGNPIDFFEKDKAKLGFERYFQQNYQTALNEYQEITARRNIFAHNNGCVDRKYIREVVGCTFVLDEKIAITKDYLRESIFLLHGLSTIVVNEVLKKNYGSVGLKTQYQDYITKFDMKYMGR